jgi:glyoxylase-like metal-dependent hydrolase (beta-lactamase superfamily II)
VPEHDDLLAAHDVALVRAANPGPFTLQGTNTWLAGRDPCWVVDPGPALDAHVAAVHAESARRGGIGGIALTHDHADHAGAVGALRARAAAAGGGAPPLGAARALGDDGWTDGDVVLRDGETFGPLRALATPGHAPDHLAFVAGDVVFAGDAVLGAGSVFVAPDPGALAGYLEGLRRLRALDLALLCPGHGPLVADPAGRIDGYVAHRLERERRLLDALADGLRTVDALLDRVWDDAPAVLRPAAAVTLAAHLDKLGDEGRLPAGVARPAWPPPGMPEA